MNLPNKKYLKTSKNFIVFEILINLFYFIIGLVPIIFYVDYSKNIIYQMLFLLIFLFINLFLKIICLINKISFKSKFFLHIPLFIYALFLIILSLICLNGISLQTIILLFIFIYNSEYNYFIFQKKFKK